MYMYVLQMYAVLMHREADVRGMSWGCYMKLVSCGAGQRSPDLDDSLLSAVQSISVSANKWERVVLFMANLGTYTL